FDRLRLLESEPAALRLRLLRDGGGALLLVVGIHGAHDVGGAHLAATDRRHHLLDRGARQPRQRALELFVGIDDFRALAEPLDAAAAQARALIAHGRAAAPPDGSPPPPPVAQRLPPPPL